MKILLQLLLLLIIIQANSTAISLESYQQNTSVKPLIIAVQYDQTFVQKNKEGKLTGPIVDLCDLIAKELKRSYIFKEMSLNEIVIALQKGTIDVAATTMLITAEREKLFDFSTPLGETRPSVLTLYKVKHEHPWIEAIELFLSWRTLKIIFILLAVVMSLGIVMWLMEKKYNPEDFSRSPFKGIAAGIFWAGSILASGLCLGINLRTLKGRILGLIWMMLCALALGAFIASLTHSLTDQLEDMQLLNDADLRYMHLGIKKGASQLQTIKDIGSHYTLYDTDEDAINALLKGQIDGYISPEARAYYFANRMFKGQVSVFQTSLRGYLYALAMPMNSPLRRPINAAILKLLDNSSWESLLKDYGLEKVPNRSVF